MGMEYSVAHSDVKDKARAKDGVRYNISFVLNTLEDVMYVCICMRPHVPMLVQAGCAWGLASRY